MRNQFMSIIAVTLSVAACGASFPAPTQRMADAESAARSAKEVGSDSQPTARLMVKLANEQISSAKVLIENHDNARADFVLLRARADAELGLALAREQAAQGDLDRAKAQAASTLATNSEGARP